MNNINVLKSSMRKITKLKFGIHIDAVTESEYISLLTILVFTRDLSRFIMNPEKQTGMIYLHVEDIILENPYIQIELDLDEVR